MNWRRKARNNAWRGWHANGRNGSGLRDTDGGKDRPESRIGKSRPRANLFDQRAWIEVGGGNQTNTNTYIHTQYCISNRSPMNNTCTLSVKMSSK